jgi:2-phospho-L-lactate transferase/gluconeogenesis factor (CofD/UPF0052 family)
MKKLVLISIASIATLLAQETQSSSTESKTTVQRDGKKTKVTKDSTHTDSVASASGASASTTTTAASESETKNKGKNKKTKTKATSATTTTTTPPNQ